MEWLKKFKNSSLLLIGLGIFLTAIPLIMLLLGTTEESPSSFVMMTEIAMGLTMLLAGVVGVLSHKKQKGMIFCLLVGIIAFLAAGLNVVASFILEPPSTLIAWFVLAYPVVIAFYVIEAFNLVKSGLAK